MSTQTFNSSLAFFCGAVLVGAVGVLWLTSVRAVVRVLAVQGLALGAVAATLGFHFHDAGLVATAVVVVAIKAVVIPALLRRIGSVDATERERVRGDLHRAGAIGAVEHRAEARLQVDRLRCGVDDRALASPDHRLDRPE